MIDPELYSKYKSMQTNDNIFVLEKFLNLVKWKHCPDRNQTALDIGCGDGYSTCEILLPKLPKCVGKLFGCDMSDRVVQFAKETRENPRLDFCRINVCNGHTCSVFRENFDYVFSFYCLHWISEQRKAFKNIYKLLKPGGDMLLSFLGTTPIFDVYNNLSKNIQWAPYITKNMISPYHNCEHPQEVIRNILEEVGFEGCKVIVEDRQYVFANWSQLKKSMIAVNPILPQLTPKEKTEFLHDFTDEVRRYYKYTLELCDNNNDEKIIIDYKLIIVYASKSKILC